jgi:TM2 domain-containing membrane protein YozV
MSNSEQTQEASISSKNRLLAFILCFFLGWIGMHRFYVGKIITGVLQVFTFGGFGFWVFIDLILIAIGKFNDKDGMPVLNWH